MEPLLRAELILLILGGAILLQNAVYHRAIAKLTRRNDPRRFMKRILRRLDDSERRLSEQHRALLSAALDRLKTTLVPLVKARKEPPALPPAEDGPSFSTMLNYYYQAPPEPPPLIGEAPAMPEAARRQLELGEDHREAGRVEEASTAYQMAILLDPGLAIAYLQLGRLACLEGRLNEAVDWVDNALSRDPSLIDSIRDDAAFSALRQHPHFSELFPIS